MTDVELHREGRGRCGSDPHGEGRRGGWPRRQGGLDQARESGAQARGLVFLGRAQLGGKEGGQKGGKEGGKEGGKQGGKQGSREGGE